MKITHEWDLNNPEEKEEYTSLTKNQQKIGELENKIYVNNKKLAVIYELAENILNEIKKTPDVSATNWLKITCEKIQENSRY